MAKILFLDIDGVCNNNKTRERFRGSILGIDPILAGRVKRIIKETGCDVVLSSAWRLDADSREYVRQHVTDFIDVTPRSPDGFRGKEVDTWMTNRGDKPLIIKRHAILDDGADFFTHQTLFQTSWEEGLTDEIADQVIQHLNSLD